MIETFTTGLPHTYKIVINAQIEFRFVAEVDLIPIGRQSKPFELHTIPNGGDARISKAKRRKRVTRDMSTLKNSMLELAAKFDDNYNTGLIKSFMFGLNKTEIKTMTDILSRYKFRDSHGKDVKSSEAVKSWMSDMRPGIVLLEHRVGYTVQQGQKNSLKTRMMKRSAFKRLSMLPEVFCDQTLCHPKQ
ncbi:hypothetical protein TNCV_3658341 [Trichonephila clavipes]|nr:hypothetical protein TNCV_3658341 [Trichonephila clavipes]